MAVEEIATVAARLQPSPDQDHLLKQAIDLQQKTADTNRSLLKQREEWQIVEREHMKVCERRYRALVDGQPEPTTVKH